MRRWALLLVVVLLGGTAGCTTTRPPAPVHYRVPVVRPHADLDHGWRFHLTDPTHRDPVGKDPTRPGFDDSAWTPVSTPHTWDANSSVRGVGWYRQHLHVPDTWTGKDLILDFAGANQVADVWVNGLHLGTHRGGYAAFRFDATNALRTGRDNVLVVRVDNTYNPDIAPLTADYTFDGGIYRDVDLWAVDPTGITMLDNGGPGVYLHQHGATVEVSAKLTGPAGARLRTVVTDRDGLVVATGGTTVTIPHPHRWNGRADPYLYQVTVEVHRGADITDAVTQPLGLRDIAVDPDTGFSLNGRHLALHGVALHQDRAGVGWAQTPADHEQDFDLIADLGANAIRMAHYQHDQADYTLADERGFLVWAEIPLVDNTTASEAFTASTEQQLRELIAQNYNHPSIVFWGIGNEQDHDTPAANALLSDLAGIAHTMDPDRFSGYATCCVGDTAAVTEHTRVVGYNEYLGWYAGKTGDFGPWADRLHAEEPGRDIGVTEYGAGGNVNQHAADPAAPAPAGQFHPEEYQDEFHEALWRQIESRQYLWGSFVWNMFDFASADRDEGGQPGLNDKGLVTRDRAIRKDSFFWYRANWSSAPTLYITSRRWTTRTDPHTDLKVYANATTVTASLNGTSLGALPVDDHIVTWPGITLRPGPNTLTVRSGTETDTVTWSLT